jgi:hypothetical protein
MAKWNSWLLLQGLLFATLMNAQELTESKS